MQTQPGLDEMMMNRVHSHLVETIKKRRKGVRAEGRRQHHDVGRAEVKRLMRRTRPAHVMRVQEFAQNLHHPPPQSLDRSELSDVHTRKLFRQRWLVTGEQTPMREVVRKTLANEVMLLQRSKCVLKYG